MGEPEQQDEQMSGAASRPPPLPDPVAPPSRPRTRGIGIAVVTLVLAFIGFGVCGVGYFSHEIYELWRSEAATVDVDRPGGPLDQYRRNPHAGHVRLLQNSLVTEAFARLDPRPYFNSRLWLGLRVSMALRAAALGLAFVAAILQLAGARFGPALLGAAMLILVLLGAFEAVLGYRDARLLVEEYHRDSMNSFRMVTDEAGLSDEFPGLRLPFDPPSIRGLRMAALFYFMLASAPWQFLLLAELLVFRRRPEFEGAAAR